MMRFPVPKRSVGKSVVPAARRIVSAAAFLMSRQRAAERAQGHGAEAPRAPDKSSDDIETDASEDDPFDVDFDK